MNKTFIILLTALFLSPLFSLLLSKPAHADWLLDRSGTLVKVDGYVLGDGDSAESEAEKNRMEQAREMAKNRQESVREAAKQRLENQTEARKKEQEKLETKSRVEVKNEENRLKIKQEIRDKNDNLVRKQEIEVKAGERFMVENENKEKLEINAVKDGSLELEKNHLKANSNLPIKIDDKNQISVTLPNGKNKEITLPDKAIEGLVNKGIIVPTEAGTNTYELKSGNRDNPVYTVKDAIVEKRFGPFAFKVRANVDVAASNNQETGTTAGDVVNTEITDTNPFVRFFARFAK